jgi:hypothetical protein
VSSLLLGCLGGTSGTALLEAFAAEDRPSLGWAERNGGVLTALGAGGFGFRPHLSAATAAFGALGFAGFTSFGFVLEPFVREKHLFAGRKYKLGAALRTLQDLVMEFHVPFPP